MTWDPRDLSLEYLVVYFTFQKAGDSTNYAIKVMVTNGEFDAAVRGLERVAARMKTNFEYKNVGPVLFTVDSSPT